MLSAGLASQDDSLCLITLSFVFKSPHALFLLIDLDPGLDPDSVTAAATVVARYCVAEFASPAARIVSAPSDTDEEPSPRPTAPQPTVQSERESLPSSINLKG